MLSDFFWGEKCDSLFEMYKTIAVLTIVAILVSVFFFMDKGNEKFDWDEFRKKHKIGEMSADELRERMNLPPKEEFVTVTQWNKRKDAILKIQRQVRKRLLRKKHVSVASPREYDRVLVGASLPQTLPNPYITLLNFPFASNEPTKYP